QTMCLLLVPEMLGKLARIRWQTNHVVVGTGAGAQRGEAATRQQVRPERLLVSEVVQAEILVHDQQGAARLAPGADTVGEQSQTVLAVRAVEEQLQLLHADEQHG